MQNIFIGIHHLMGSNSQPKWGLEANPNGDLKLKIKRNYFNYHFKHNLLQIQTLIMM